MTKRDRSGRFANSFATSRTNPSLQVQVMELFHHPLKGWRMVGVFAHAQFDAVRDHYAGDDATTPFLVPESVPIEFVEVYRRAYSRTRVELRVELSEAGKG